MCIVLVGSKRNNFITADYRKRYIVDEYHYESNIDDKNSMYCELTGMYWLWKHNTDSIVRIRTL